MRDIFQLTTFFLFVGLISGGCYASINAIDKSSQPPPNSKPGTWVEKINDPFVLENKTCQIYVVYSGILVDGKPWANWNHEHYAIGRFVRCEDQIMNMEAHHKSGWY